MLETIIEQSTSLASICLSQPWEQTDSALRKRMTEWHSQLGQFSKQLCTDDPEKVQALLQALQQSIQRLSEALQTRNPVELSNTLELQWVPTLRQLMEA